MKEDFKVYIGGKLNSDAVGYLNNVHLMMETAEEARLEGFSVFVPAIDLLMGIKFGYDKYEEYFDNSQPWLKVSDGLLLVENFKDSKGTAKEVKTALDYGIPVFIYLDDMIAYRDDNKNGKHIVALSITDGLISDYELDYAK